MPWADRRTKQAYDSTRDRTEKRQRYYQERERERAESGYNRRRWKKDARRGNTPKKDLQRMYDRFIEEMDPETDLLDIRRRAQEFFADGAGATPARIGALQRQAAERIARRIVEKYDLAASATRDGVIIPNRAGQQRITDAVFEREVRSRPGARPYVQLVDARTGRILGQRKGPL